MTKLFFLYNRINTLLDDIENIDNILKDKLKAEIRLLQVQLILSILVAAGSVIAFFVLNLSSINKLFPNPKFKIEVEDTLIKKEGVVSIKSNNIKEPKMIKLPLSDTLQWFSVETGSYQLSIIYKGKEIWCTDFFLESGEKEVIKVPKQFEGNIKIFIDHRIFNPLPMESLKIKVNSTGNGYLWIYELTNDFQYKLIFPETITCKMSNEINVGVPFKFPSDECVITTGNEEGEESLLFIVTSIQNEDFAQKLANKMSKSIIGKAAISKKEYNWGVSKLLYTIRKP